MWVYMIPVGKSIKHTYGCVAIAIYVDSTLRPYTLQKMEMEDTYSSLKDWFK